MRSTAILCLIGFFAVSVLANEELWQRSHRAHADESHSVIFAVKLQKDALATCDSMLMEVSDPESESYGKYLSMEEVGKLTVDPRANRAVRNWLTAHNANFEATQNGDFLKVTGTVGQIEELINAEYYHYVSEHTSTSIKRSEMYALPTEIASYVDFVSNTVNFPPVRTTIMSSKAPEQSGSVSPSTISTTYSIASNVVASTKSTQSVFEGLGQNYAESDLASFEQQFNIPSEKVYKVIGPNDPSQCSSNPDNCAEATLDIQYIIAVAQKAPTTFWSISNSDPDPFTDWIVAVGNTTVRRLALFLSDSLRTHHLSTL
jgi:tripeptidyl-peptidase-1